MAREKKVTSPNGEQAPKKACPVTKEQFLADAKPITITVNGVPMVAVVKEFSTGSFGWYLSGKTAVQVGETPVAVQLGFNLTCVGSKPAG